jgi:hypothetical protein
MKVKQHYTSFETIGTAALPAASAVGEGGYLEESFPYVKIGRRGAYVTWVLLSNEQRRHIADNAPGLADQCSVENTQRVDGSKDFWYNGSDLWVRADWLLSLKPAGDLTWAARLIYTALESIE